MKTVILASSLLSLFALFSGAAAADEKALLKTPVSPEVLLTALPPANPTWTLVRSEGEAIYDDGLKSSAVRVFRPAAVASANSPDGQAPAATAEVKVVLSDFGGWIPGDFENFKPGKDGDRERYQIGSYPAISLTRDRQRRIKVLLASRYVVEITFVDLPREKAESWLQALNFEGLRGSQSVPVTPGQHEFLIRYVDELQPARNRQHRLVVSAPQASAPGQEAAAQKP